jgi:myo-inositol-1(or 4)-monophosphatase
MDQSELQAAYTTALSLADWACDAIREAAGRAREVRTKRHAADFVTATDEQVERYVRDQLAQALPHHAVVGEEQGGSSGASGAPTWYVDPLDGTANFVHGVPWFSFSLGLVVEGEPVLGVIADPMRSEVFHALRGSGAFLGDEPISAARTGQLAGGIVMSELAGRGARAGLQTLVPWLSQQQTILRIMGSAALTLANAAAGRAAVAVLSSFQPWDVAAGVAICREAGATVRDGRGHESGMPERGLVAGHADAVAQIWSVLHQE